MNEEAYNGVYLMPRNLIQATQLPEIAQCEIQNLLRVCVEQSYCVLIIPVDVERLFWCHEVHVFVGRRKLS